MSSTQPITSNSQLFSSGNATEKTVKSTADSAQDRFMKLLVTQMKNQNPHKPL
ncbi:MAG: flagellar hook capping FlgD N-terminal domain-containing protein, partial [Pseudomonadota bacterium]